MIKKPSSVFASAAKSILLSVLKMIGIMISWLFTSSGWLLSKTGKLIQSLILKHS